MTSIHSMTGGNYWKAADLGGGEVSATISGFTVEMVGRDEDKEQCCVAKVADSEKGIVIRAKDNVTPLLERFKTDQIEDWNTAVQAAPLPVTLYTVQTNMGAGLRLRIRETVPTPPPVQSNTLGVGQNNPLSMFTSEQLAAMSPEQIAALAGG